MGMWHRIPSPGPHPEFLPRSRRFPDRCSTAMTSYQTFRRQGAPAGLDFTVEAPTDWVAVPLPDEPTDFSDPTNFAPIGVLMAPYAAIVFVVAARPAYADGALAQWLEYAARQRGLDPGVIEAEQIGPHDGVGCWGVQNENGTVLRARLSMFVDGDRLVHVNCMAPAGLWPALTDTFAHLMQSFALQQPKGTAVPLAEAGRQLPPSSFVRAGTTDSTAATVPPLTSPANEPAAPLAAEGPLGLPEAEPVAAAAVALADTMLSFEAEHPLNARLRDSGVGLVPNVLDYHEQERWATLAAGAIRATLRVPFGWHVIDDGRRTLVFDAGGHTQVNLQLTRRDGQSDEQILAGKVDELQREWPAMEHLRTEVLGMASLCVRGGSIDGKPIEQAYLLRSAPDGLVLQTRVTSSPERFAQACDLAEVLLRDLQLAGDKDS